MSGLDIRLRTLIGQLQARPLLVVIDAVERWLTGWVASGEVEGFGDFSMRQGAHEGLDRFLVEASALDNGSHVILSSRALPAALDTVACTILPLLPTDACDTGLQALPPEAGAELLLDLGVMAPREKLVQLAESMFGHPLTLTGFARVARRLGSKWESLLASQGRDPGSAFHSLVDEIRKHLPDRPRSESILRYLSLLSEGASLGLLGWLALSEPVNVLRPPDNDTLLPLILMLADWNLLTWNPADEEVRLHGLMAGYFIELLEPAQRESIHRRAAVWYAAQDREGGDMRDGILAVRHALDANDTEAAHVAMFQASGETRSLYHRMLSNGHLWECAGVLETLHAQSVGTRKAQVVVAWGQILYDLELPRRVLGAVQEATQMLLARDGPRLPEVEIVLARCFGLEAVIHLETGRATEALPLLERAAGMLHKLAEAGNASREDFITTVANRGRAKWSVGDWDGAEADWRSTIESLRSAPEEAGGPMIRLCWELEARVAMLDVDRGQPATAIPRLAVALRELERLRPSATGNASKTSLHTRMLLVAAYIENGQSEEALAEARGIATALEDLSRLGHWEFHGLLAQLRMNEATALLQQGKFMDALAAADEAAILYEDMQRRGAVQFRGQYATALFRRAEARIGCGDWERASDDVRCALATSESWLQQWYGECNIQGIFIQNALRALACIPSSCSGERLEVIRLLRECAGRIASTPNPLAATVREKQVLLRHREDLKRIFLELGIAWDPVFP
jgi:tetratricopeptide (TPR) repeat protein